MACVTLTGTTLLCLLQGRITSHVMPTITSSCSGLSTIRMRGNLEAHTVAFMLPCTCMHLCMHA